MAAKQEQKSIWLDEEGQLYEYSAQSPAPSKDFNQVVVTPTTVIMRSWKISHRQAEVQRLHPQEQRENHAFFLQCDEMQNWMTTAFGESMTDYVINLCKGRLDYMERLPDPVLLQIFMRADLQDVGRLSQLNKRFHRIGNEDQLWRSKFAEASTVTDELAKLARQSSWKALYFSDKLRIQVQLSRKRKMIEVRSTSAPVVKPRRSARNAAKE